MHKLISLLVLAAAVLGGFVYGLNNYLRLEDPLEKADAIVAVSGGDTTARAEKAVELYAKQYAPLLIFSGAAADPSSPSNARVMQEIAVQRGVPASAIRIDELSRDTRENAAGIKNYLQNSEKIILVTSEYHQRRANKEVQASLPDTEIINAPSEDKNWNPKTWWLTPYGWWVTTGEIIKNIL